MKTTRKIITVSTEKPSLLEMHEHLGELITVTLRNYQGREHLYLFTHNMSFNLYEVGSCCRTLTQFLLPYNSVMRVVT